MNSDPQTPAIDHAIRCDRDAVGRVSFYIHPLNEHGETVDFFVIGNQLVPKHGEVTEPLALSPLDMMRLLNLLTHWSKGENLPKGNEESAIAIAKLVCQASKHVCPIVEDL